MLRSENRYTRFVTLAKITLPLIAVALLSSLFLLARSPGTTTQIPYSESELAEIIRGERVKAPNYRGVLDTGTAIALNADTARPDPEHDSRTLADVIRLTLDESGGAQIKIAAGTGSVDTLSRLARGDQGLQITHSDGFTMTSWSGWARLDGTRAETDGTLTLTSPHLSLTAGRMIFTQQAGGRDQLLVFTDGVKLVYDPGSDKD